MSVTGSISRALSFRFVSGLAEAIAWIALVAILLKFYPDQDTSIAAYAELLLGLGYMIGKSFRLCIALSSKINPSHSDKVSANWYDGIFSPSLFIKQLLFLHSQTASGVR